jgi:Cell wall-associated hydrolases (invasion-associated proteins)
MSKKIILLALLMLFTASDFANGKVRKKRIPVQKPKMSLQLQERIDEIDNYDFLYNEGGDDLNYDVLTINSIMDEAMSHIGARYRSGSKGPTSFDCSGFTSYVFRNSGGVEIGCSSRDQYAKNMPISRSEMQRGDLVFFTSPNSGRNVGHVGIIIDVDPLTQTFSFIHASSSKGVTITNSSDGFYARRFVGVRRVLY